MILLVSCYKMALINVRTYSHWTLKDVRDFYAYPPLHHLSVPIREQCEHCCPPYICAALGEGVVADRICPDCFKRFHDGDTSLENRPRSRRPLQSDIERIKVLIEDNPSLTPRELSAMLGYNQSTIDRHLHHVGKVNKLRTWLPHQLILDNIQQRIIICHFLLSKRNQHRFLQQIVTGDENWLLCIEDRRKTSMDQS